MVGSPLKFLCSYGGRILPRYPDGKLRYNGGETRLLSVHRSISFSELVVKLEEMYGSSVSLRCQLPMEDLDSLVSITSDEDLANLIEEYDRAAEPLSSLKIRAFLSAPKSTKKSTSPTSSASSSSNGSTSPKSPFYPPYHPDTRRPAAAAASGTRRGRRCTPLSARKPPENSLTSMCINATAMEMAAMFTSSTTATTGNSTKKLRRN